MKTRRAASGSTLKALERAAMAMFHQQTKERSGEERARELEKIAPYYKPQAAFMRACAAHAHAQRKGAKRKGRGRG
jgi:hypothetical protein